MEGTSGEEKIGKALRAAEVVVVVRENVVAIFCVWIGFVCVRSYQPQIREIWIARYVWFASSLCPR